MTKVEILVAGIVHSTDSRTGDDVTFRLHFEQTAADRDPVFVITLAGSWWWRCTSPSKSRRQRVPMTVDGTGHVDIEMRAPAAHPGRTLSTEVTGWGRTRVYDHIQNARSLTHSLGEQVSRPASSPTWTWTATPSATTATPDVLLNGST